MFVFSVILGFLSIFLSSTLASNDTLVFVQTLSRHGARSPIHTYPHDNYNESQWFQGYGQLTKIGMQEALDFGAFLRDKYVTKHKLLSPQYILKEMHVRSTTIDRTLLTAHLTMQGLFPPSLPHNPVPIHSVAEEDDKLLNANCEVLDKRITNEYLIKEFRKKSEKYEEILKSLIEKLDFKPESYFNVTMLADSLKCKNFNNFTLPPWASDNDQYFFKFLMDFKNVDFEVEFNRYDNARLKAGLLLGVMVQNLKNKLNVVKEMPQKAFFYFAHDTTVAPLLAALKVYDNLQPPFISTVIIELYKVNKSNEDGHKNDTDINNYYVKVLYRNDTASDPLTLKLPGCSVNCPLERFVNLTKENVVENWDEVCLSPKPMPRKDLILFVIIGLLSLCIILLLLCAILRCRKGVPYHRYIDVPTDME